MIIFIG